MSITSTTTARADRETGGTHSAQSARKNRALWATQVLLAAVFTFAAMPKLAGAHSAVAMFGQIGAGQWLRYLVGTAELAGAVGLLIPRLTGLAAAGLAADMAGASIINIAVLHSAAVVLTIPLCAILVLLARTRWEHAAKFLAARTGR
jgi:putative oxidoreductase